MADKKRKSSHRKEIQPTVVHASSAESVQDIRTDYNREEREERKNAGNRRKHNGSDGANQERGSNH